MDSIHTGDCTVNSCVITTTELQNFGMNYGVSGWETPPFIGYSTPVNIYSQPQMEKMIVETDKSLVIKMAVPGLTSEDVDASIRGNMLTVKTEQSDFLKITETPFIIDTNVFNIMDTIDAVVVNGILTITIDRIKPDIILKVK